MADIYTFGQETYFNAKATFFNTIEGSLNGNVTGNVTGNVIGNVTGNVSGNVSGNLNGNLNGNIYSTGISTFSTLKIFGPLYDSSSSLGASGQILSSNGTATLWINSSSASVGSATSVGTNLDSANLTRYLTFVESTSGNNIIRVDSDLTYNPSTNTLTAGTFSGSGASLTSIPNSALSNSTISGVSLGSNLSTLTLNTSGTGLSGSTTYNGSGSATFTVASNATSANTVSTIVARDGSGNFSAGTITATLTGTASALVTGSSYQVGSFGVGTAASGTSGEIRATNNITAYYSDRRLKENIKPIPSALSKILALNGVTFNSNKLAEGYGYYDKKEQVGVIAQEVEAVLPQIVVAAPFDIGQDENGNEYSISGENYKTVQYDKLVPLLIEGIKEQQQIIEKLQKRIENLENR